MKFFKKLNLTVVVFCVCCIAFVAFLAYNPSHAYFQVHKDAIGVNTAKVDLLFDKYADSVFTLENSEDSLEEEKRTYKGPELNQNAEWGTEANPYIIRKKNHINNLAMLHKAGYFEDKTGQSYFVVCNLDGTPVAINCSEDSEMEIAPIGTPSNPFTGNISGAYIVGEATYGNYKVTQSTIANLKIVATSETPDVGFFGRLGYTGTRVETTTNVDTGSKDEDGNPIYITEKTITIENGYSANISNLIFADVTISVSESIATSVADWWASFGNRTISKNGSNVTEQIDKARDDCKETHHVGILAGHVDFGKIANISIYYSSDSVAAFDFKESNNSNTNFYSITGIIGTAEYVNPSNPLDANGNPQVNILSSEGAITDEDLLNVVSGGGGDESGTLTGYMWAKNIFSRHEEYLENNGGTTSNQYNVAELKAKSGDSLFKKVVMREGPYGTPIYKHYYYFADSIFTFAMSMSTDTNEKGTTQGTPDPNASDYLIKIWDCDEESSWDGATPPPITIYAADANGNDAWSYDIDPNSELYAHKLVRATTLKANTKYVVAYINSDGQIYTFDMGNSTDGYKKLLNPWHGTYVSGSGASATDVTIAEPTITSTTNELYVLSSSSTDCGYSLTYKDSEYASETFITGKGTNSFFKFGVTSTAWSIVGVAGTEFDDATITTAIDQTNTSGKSYTWYWYTWEVTSASNSTFQVYMKPDFKSGNWTTMTTHFNIRLVFDTQDNQFEIRQARSTDSTPADTAVSLSNCSQDLIFFEVVESFPTKDAMNMVPPTSATSYSFNPSTDVLFYTSTTNGRNFYSVEPLLSKQWLSGKPEYLESLNHAVKLYRAATENYQLRISETFIGRWVGGLLDNNDGGVMEVPIGIDKKGYTIPAGMIAFAINEASEGKPSYINIVVAVNPEMTYSSSIGLYDMNQNNTWSSEFSLANPAQSFPLPISKKVTDASDAKYATYISNYTTSNGSGGWTTHPGTYTTHLRGETVLVGYSFSVTSPGIYLIGSGTGPMTVAYFSVDGAAGAGGDGTGGTPLGNIDFVYSNTAGTVISVDHKFSGNHVLAEEDVESYYYPSYYYVRMFPEVEKTVSGTKVDAITIPWQTISIHRYLDTSTEYDNLTRGRRRWIKVTADNPDGTSAIGLMYIFEDNLVGEDYS